MILLPSPLTWMCWLPRCRLCFGAPTHSDRTAVFLNPGNGTISANGQQADLTKNELKILQILFEHQGRVVSRDAIMTKLWESDSFVDDNTLTVNITRIRRKLESLGIRDFIVTKKGLGYMV